MKARPIMFSAPIEQDEVFESTNSYFGLLRLATSSHHDQAVLANAARRRGHCVHGGLTKIYKRPRA